MIKFGLVYKINFMLKMSELSICEDYKMKRVKLNKNKIVFIFIF